VSRAALLGLVLLSVAGCGGDDDFESKPVDVSGVYNVAVTNKSNACSFPNWEDGKSTTGIPLTMTQSGTDISGSIDGIAGGLVKLLLGSNTFQGTVDGKEVHATNFGTNSFNQVGCTYTINMTLDGELQGDALQGTLHYRPKTNGSPDCGSLESCESVQDFSGVRAPK
jgi:hypothetical protein